ncbi:hypothetical protein QJS10_CPA01g02023 [Acorus calamus]|uniref:Uncharacterized protein n=1 Tax=Acorus calamus TaxID=4465 RepID=A0AAV9FH28_ACOCL|nr:hypothetical protein QJS10_CPA01g02023 [Acorus calamus]
MSSETRAGSPWKRWELLFLVLYAIAFYAVIIRRSLQLSHEHSGRLYGMRQGWISNRLNDTSDPQWRNFRGNLPILTFVFGFKYLEVPFSPERKRNVSYLAITIHDLFNISPWSLWLVDAFVSFRGLHYRIWGRFGKLEDLSGTVLNFMWLKFLLIWRYFRFWSLTAGIEAPENMPKCINNCYDLEGFWKSWHASFNKWLVKCGFITLFKGKLLSWAWLTCLFFMPEMIVKSAATAYQAKNALGELVLRELSAVAGAITITCLMVANLVGYVIGPSGINWLISRLLHKDGLPVLGGIFTSFYVGTKAILYLTLLRQIHESQGEKWIPFFVLQN